LLIDNYFENIRNILTTFPLINKFELETEKRSETLGFIRGNAYFNDGSLLHIREFVDTEISINIGKYTYQYMSKEGDLIFRYDNAPHHQKLNLSTFPHHKHDRREDNIVTSEAPSLENVCQEITRIMNQ
jgi:glycogen debranching enzyme